MSKSVIHIEQIPGSGWQVSGGKDGPRFFRIREHALAFGRALAYSTRSELFVSELNGYMIRQTRASITYPLDLN